MHVITWKVLKEFGERYPAAASPLKAWRSVIEKSRFQSPAELKAQFATASFVGNRTIFNIGGNKFRLIVIIRYDIGKVYVRGIMTHEEYDTIDVGKL